MLAITEIGSALFREKLGSFFHLLFCLDACGVGGWRGRREDKVAWIDPPQANLWNWVPRWIGTCGVFAESGQWHAWMWLRTGGYESVLVPGTEIPGHNPDILASFCTKGVWRCADSLALDWASTSGVNLG